MLERLLWDVWTWKQENEIFHVQMVQKLLQKKGEEGGRQDMRFWGLLPGMFNSQCQWRTWADGGKVLALVWRQIIDSKSSPVKPEMKTFWTAM